MDDCCMDCKRSAKNGLHYRPFHVAGSLASQKKWLCLSCYRVRVNEDREEARRAVTVDPKPIKKRSRKKKARSKKKTLADTALQSAK